MRPLSGLLGRSFIRATEGLDECAIGQPRRPANPKLARQTVIDLVRDFQAHGSAEWVLGKHRAVPNYLSSVTMPLAGVRRLQAAPKRL